MAQMKRMAVERVEGDCAEQEVSTALADDHTVKMCIDRIKEKDEDVACVLERILADHKALMTNWSGDVQRLKSASSADGTKPPPSLSESFVDEEDGAPTGGPRSEQGQRGQRSVGGSATQEAEDADRVAKVEGSPSNSEKQPDAATAGHASQTVSSLVASRASSVRRDMPVEPKLLDIGDAYSAERSVWDGMICFATPAVGPLNSVILLGVWLMNVALVVVFLICVKEVFGHEAGVSSEILDGLLKFRLGVAHSVDFADRVTSRSMAAQVCDEELKLHLAGHQQDMYGELRSFIDGGPMAKVLMVLVQFFWAAVIMREFECAFTFFMALTRIPKASGETELTLVDLRHEDIEDFTKAMDGLPDVGATSANLRRISQAWTAGFWTPCGSPAASVSSSASVGVEEAVPETTNAEFFMMKTIRVESMSRTRFFCLVWFACIPRVILAGSLYYFGAKWLASTISLGDLILNSIALEFVLQFSNILFEIAAPRRVKTLVSNLEAMPVHTKAISGTAWELSKTLFKGAFLAVLMSAVVSLYLLPIFNQLEQAEAVICSGETNFIFAKNPATGMVHVTRTKDVAPEQFTDTELIVAQVARLDLFEDGGWGEFHDMGVFEASRSEPNDAWAVVTPAADSLEDAELTPEAFAEIIQMSVWSVADAASVLPCDDLGQNKKASLQALRLIVGNESIQSCGEVPQERCAEMNLPELRALCPRRCGCELAVTNSVGFFGTPQFGCPRQCDTFKAATNEISYRFSFNDYTGIETFREYEEADTCSDLDQSEFGFAGGCSNADNDGTATSYFLWGCAEYDRHPSSCGSTDLDDEDFTAAEMCCACGGGNSVPASSECWDEWTPACWQMPPKARAWLLYVKGLFNFSLSQPGFNLTVKNVIQLDYAGLNTTKRLGSDCNSTRGEPWLDSGNNSAALLEHITSAALGRALASGTWEILPGKPHPRLNEDGSGTPLVGCDFLSSYELTSLLNIDLCNPGDKTSIKFFCPKACGCSPSSPLSECPAACILTDCTQETCRHVHPWYADVDTIAEAQQGISSSCCGDTDGGSKGDHEVTCDAPPLELDGTEDPKFCLGCWDNDDFTAGHMCCGCSGGSTFNASRGQCFDGADGCPIEAEKGKCGHTGYPASSLCCACGGGEREPMLSLAFAVLNVDYDSLSQNAPMLESVRSSMVALMEDIYEPSRGAYCAPAASISVRLSPGSLVVKITMNTHSRLPDVYRGLSESMERLTGEQAFLGRVASSIEGIPGMECCMTSNITALPPEFFRGNATGLDAFENVNTTLAAGACDGTLARGNNLRGCEDLLGPQDIACTEGHGDDSDFTARDMCCACSEALPCFDQEGGRRDGRGDSCAIGYSLGNGTYCGGYDDSDFTASILCCGCGGGAHEVPMEEPENATWSPDAECGDSDAGATDSRTYSCSDSYVISNGMVYYCGNYDDEDFTSSIVCCNCGGGEIGTACHGTAGPALDAGSYNCELGYVDDKYCGNYDDTDFTSNLMCCECLGGSTA